eukprot:g6223.t1
MNYKVSDEESVEQLRILFNAFDIDKKGTLHCNEATDLVYAIFSEFEQHVSKEKCRKHVNEMKCDSSKNIAFDEVLHWYRRQLPSLRTRSFTVEPTYDEVPEAIAEVVQEFNEVPSRDTVLHSEDSPQDKSLSHLNASLIDELKKKDAMIERLKNAAKLEKQAKDKLLQEFFFLLEEHDRMELQLNQERDKILTMIIDARKEKARNKKALQEQQYRFAKMKEGKENERNKKALRKKKLKEPLSGGKIVDRILTFLDEKKLREIHRYKERNGLEGRHSRAQKRLQRMFFEIDIKLGEI